MTTILHIAHAFCPDRSGTAERIYNTQPRDDYKHIILKPAHENWVYEYESFIVVCVLLPHDKKSRWTTWRNARFLAKKAQQLIDDHDVNILYGHNPLLCSWATLEVTRRNKEIKLIYEPHNLLYSHYQKRINEGKTGLSRWLLAIYHSNLVKIENALFQKANVIISQTESLSKKIQEIYSINNSKICIAYNGLPDLQIDQAALTSVSEDLPNDKFAVYGGDLSRNNGLHLILSLVENNPDIQVVIAGSGAYTEKLVHASKQYDNLKFLGSLDKAQYLAVLQLAEVLLILRESDLTNENYLPLKLLDAIALGKKVITTDLKIMREIQESYPQLLFTTLDVRQIAKVIKHNFNQEPHFANNLNVIRPERLSWAVSRTIIAEAIRKFA